MEQIMEAIETITVVDLGPEHTEAVLRELIEKKYGVMVLSMQFVSNGTSVVASVAAPQTKSAPVGTKLKINFAHVSVGALK